MYYFLVTFPPHQSTTALVCANATPIEVAFPQNERYQILYSIYALKSCLSYQLRNVRPVPRHPQRIECSQLLRVLQAKNSSRTAFSC